MATAKVQMAWSLDREVLGERQVQILLFLCDDVASGMDMMAGQINYFLMNTYPIAMMSKDGGAMIASVFTEGSWFRTNAGYICCFMVPR